MSIRPPSSGGGAGGGVAEVIGAGNLGATYSLDMSGKSKVLVVGVLNANCTITVSNLTAGAEIVLDLTQDGTGGRTVSLPAASYPSGVTPLVTSTAGATTVLRYYSPDGTNLRGVSDTQPVLEQRVSGATMAVSLGSPTFTSQGGGYLSTWVLSASADNAITTAVSVPSDWATFAVDFEWIGNGGTGNQIFYFGYAFWAPGDNFTSSGQVTVGPVTAAVATSQLVQRTTVVSSITNQPGKTFNCRPRRMANDAADTATSTTLFVAVILRKLS